MAANFKQNWNTFKMMSPNLLVQFNIIETVQKTERKNSDELF